MKNLLLSTAIGDIAGMPYEFRGKKAFHCNYSAPPTGIDNRLTVLQQQG